MNTTNFSPVVGALDTDALLTIVLCSIFAFLGVGGNILNLIVLPRLPDGSMGEATKFLFLSISISGLLQALTSLARPIVLSNVEWTAAYAIHSLCKVIGIIESWLIGTSAYFILFINLDRYIFVMWPYTYNNIVTKNRALIIVIFFNLFTLGSYLISLGLSNGSFNNLQFIPAYGGCLVPFKNSDFWPYALSFYVFVCLVPCFLFFMYTRMLCIARHHARKIWDQQNAAVRLVTLGEAVATATNSKSSGHASREDIKVNPDGSLKDNAAVRLTAAGLSNSCSQPSKDVVEVDPIDPSHENAAVAAADSLSSCGQLSHGEVNLNSNALAQMNAAVLITPNDTISTAGPSNTCRPPSRDKTKWPKALQRNGKLKNHGKPFHRKFHTMRTPLSITASYLITWLPDTILSLVSVTSSYQPSDLVVSLTSALATGHCCVPCFVYMFMRSDFRKTVRRLICQRGNSSNI